MDFFALDEQLVEWDAELPAAQGLARLDLLARLAWHSRQRDPARAQSLIAAAVPLLPLLPELEAALLRARFQLIDAEANWLSGQLDLAQYKSEQALAVFAQGAPSAAASRGMADAYWLLAWIASDRGDCGLGDRLLAQGAVAARAAGDEIRSDVLDAAAAICAVFADWQSANQTWQGALAWT